MQVYIEKTMSHVVIDQDCENIKYTKATEVTFSTDARLNKCEFENNISIGIEKGCKYIEFSGCIFKKKVSIKSNNADSIRLRCNEKCYFRVLKINCRMDSIDIHQCEMRDFILIYTAGFVGLENNDIQNFYPHGKVQDYSGVTFINNRFGKDAEISDFDENDFEIRDFGVEVDLTNQYFYLSLLEHSDMRYNRDKYMECLYKMRLCSVQNHWGKIFLKITQGFCKPSLFFTYTVVFVFLFAILYKSLGVNSFDQALLISGNSFSTMGYPEEESFSCVIKFLCVFEALLGVVLAGCFVTSMITKYTMD